MRDSNSNDPPKLISVRIRGYKNIIDADISWAPVRVLFGPNGAGKTNILECMALLFGTDRTLALIEERADLPKPGQLECVAAVPTGRLPLPPDTAKWLQSRGRFRESAAADMRWWEQLGVSRGSTVQQALSAADLPPALRDALVDTASRPTLAYRLAAMNRFAAVARVFEPEWLLPNSPAVVAAADGDLPDVFHPLHRDRDRDLPGSMPVLELPATSRGPARLEWLARDRTSEHVTEDLVTAFDEALPSVTALLDRIRRLVTTQEDFDTDPGAYS